MVCWDPRIEEMPKDELQRMQYKLLKSLVYRLYSFSPFYHDRMKEQKVHPDDIRELADVRKLPFMFKRDLRDGYPDKIFTAPQEELVRYHVSSGTTGKPTVVGYTQNDIDLWTTSLARALTSCGLGRGDVIQVSYGYGLFTGGLGMHYGAERIGATVLPTSVGNTERQIELMQDLGSTAIACTPSYLLHQKGHQAPHRRPRCRTLDRRNAEPDAGLARHQGIRHLRDERAVRPDVHGLCRAERDPYLGGHRPD
jgi:phenylacetate-CoA ligase